MRFEEFKDMLKSGDLEQIRPHLAFEMMPADSPKTERYNDCPYIAIQDMYAIPIIWASLDDHAGSLAKSHLQENSVVILELVAEKRFDWFKMK